MMKNQIPRIRTSGSDLEQDGPEEVALSILDGGLDLGRVEQVVHVGVVAGTSVWNWV
jgi:hypothetical protein